MVEYFRCPADDLARARDAADALCPRAGYFRSATPLAYGRHAGGDAGTCRRPLSDDVATPSASQDGVLLPFDLAEVVDEPPPGALSERNGYDLLQRITSGLSAQRLYYFLRPLLPVGVRKHLQKVRLSGWDSIPFPALAGGPTRRHADAGVAWRSC